MNGEASAAVQIALAQNAGSGYGAETMMWPVVVVAILFVILVVALAVLKDAIFGSRDNREDTYNSRL